MVDSKGNVGRTLWGDIQKWATPQEGEVAGAVIELEHGGLIVQQAQELCPGVQTPFKMQRWRSFGGLIPFHGLVGWRPVLPGDICIKLWAPDVGGDDAAIAALISPREGTEVIRHGLYLLLFYNTGGTLSPIFETLRCHDFYMNSIEESRRNEFGSAFATAWRDSGPGPFICDWTPTKSSCYAMDESWYLKMQHWYILSFFGCDGFLEGSSWRKTVKDGVQQLLRGVKLCGLARVGPVDYIAMECNDPPDLSVYATALAGPQQKSRYF
jgi:hypothetical protein